MPEMVLSHFLSSVCLCECVSPCVCVCVTITAGNSKIKTLVDGFMLIYLLLVFSFLLIRDQNCGFMIRILFEALKCIIIISSVPQQSSLLGKKRGLKVCQCFCPLEGSYFFFTFPG